MSIISPIQVPAARRIISLAALGGAVALTAAAAASSSTAVARATPAAPAAPATPATPATSPAQRASTHEVRMAGGSDNARFEPANVTVKAGDAVVFVVKSGAPHNVAFDTTSLSSAQRSALRSAVHDAMLPFASPLLLKDGDRYTLSTAGLPSGTYPFYCMPHMALRMRGTLVVQ